MDLAALFKFTKSVQLNDIGVRLHIIARPPEDFVAHAYLKFKMQGLADTIWHESQVPPLSDILRWSATPDNCVYACMVEKIGEEHLDMAGLAWALHIKPLKADEAYVAECGMGFFKEYQKNSFPQEFCEMCVDHGFEVLKLVSLYGTTPMPNRAARIFHARCGFKDLTVFPNYTTWQGEVCDASITVMTRADWETSKAKQPEVQPQPQANQPQPPPVGG